MSIQVEKYLKKLEDEIDNRRTFHDGSNMLYNENFVKRHYLSGFSKNENEVVTLPDSGLKLYLKRFYCGDVSSKEYISNEVVFSRLYNALGVNAVKYYPIILRCGVENENFGRDVAVASQDLSTIKEFECVPFSAQRIFYKFVTNNYFKIQQLLENQDELYTNCSDKARARELLANFIKTGLLDIICMMVDNHLGNKKLIKMPKCVNAEDVVSFDLEDSYIDIFNNSTYEDFTHELYNSKGAYRGVIRIDGCQSSYIEYLQKMRHMRDEGVLPAECLELFENIVNLNFDELLSDTENETGLLIPEYKKDFFRKLIDINQEIFCK